MNVKTIITITLLKIHSTIENTIAMRIHNRILKMIPPIPSPTSTGSEKVKFEEMLEVSTVLNLSIICPRLSFSLIPL
jgi:hypothetical protein